MDDERARPVVVYDGECPFCLKQIERIQRRDRWARFEYTARQAPGLEARFPQLADQDFNSGMRLITPQGNIQVGADAVYHIALRLPVYRRLAWIYRIPVLHGLARLAYRWVAAHRQSLGASRGDNSCTTPADAE